MEAVKNVATSFEQNHLPALMQVLQPHFVSFQQISQRNITSMQEGLQQFDDQMGTVYDMAKDLNTHFTGTRLRTIISQSFAHIKTSFDEIQALFMSQGFQRELMEIGQKFASAFDQQARNGQNNQLAGMMAMFGNITLDTEIAAVNTTAMALGQSSELQAVMGSFSQFNLIQLGETVQALIDSQEMLNLLNAAHAVSTKFFTQFTKVHFQTLIKASIPMNQARRKCVCSAGNRNYYGKKTLMIGCGAAAYYGL